MYFLLVDNEKTGPYELDEIAELYYEGSLDSETMIWTEGWPEWENLEKAWPEIYENVPAPEPTKQLTGTHICQSCYHVANPIKVVKGNVVVEVILWLLCLIPGIFYSIWRRSGLPSGCPACGKDEMIPVNYPIGASLAEQAGFIIDWNQVVRPKAKSGIAQSDKDGLKIQQKYMEREMEEMNRDDDDNSFDDYDDGGGGDDV